MKKFWKISIIMLVVAVLVGCGDLLPMDEVEESTVLYEAESKSLSAFDLYGLFMSAEGITGISNDAVLKVEGMSDVIDDAPLAGFYTGKYGLLQYSWAFVQAVQIQDVNLEVIMQDQLQSLLDPTFPYQLISYHYDLQGEVRDTGGVFNIEFIFYVTYTKADGKIISMTLSYDTETYAKAFRDGGYYEDLRVTFDKTDLYDPDYPVLQTAAIVQKAYDDFLAFDLETFKEGLTSRFEIAFKGDPSIVPYAGLYTGPYAADLWAFDLISNWYLRPDTDDGLYEQFAVFSGNRVDIYFLEKHLILSTGLVVDVNMTHSFVVDPATGKLEFLESRNNSYHLKEFF